MKLNFVFDDDDDAEFFADGNSFAEELLHLLRLGVRGDVEILRFASQQKIAHATADPERSKARALQAGHNFSGKIAR